MIDNEYIVDVCSFCYDKIEHDIIIKHRPISSKDCNDLVADYFIRKLLNNG